MVWKRCQCRLRTTNVHLFFKVKAIELWKCRPVRWKVNALPNVPSKHSLKIKRKSCFSGWIDSKWYRLSFLLTFSVLLTIPLKSPSPIYFVKIRPPDFLCNEFLIKIYRHFQNYTFEIYETLSKIMNIWCKYNIFYWKVFIYER